MGFMFMAWGFTNLAGLPVGFLADEYGERTVIAGHGRAPLHRHRLLRPLGSQPLDGRRTAPRMN